MTPREEQRAARMYQAGRTLREIGEVLGVDQRTVARALDARGVQSRRTGPRGRLDVTDDLIVDLRQEGKSWGRIAAEVKMSRTGVRTRWLQATGQQRQR